MVRSTKRLSDPAYEHIIGRTQELAAVAGAIRRAKLTASLVLLEGPPGIGKSTLVARVRRDAAQAGFAIAYGQATPESSDRAFGPMFDALSLPVDPLGTFDAGQVGAMFAIAADRRYQMIEAICEAVELRAQRQPVAIVIEDLHAGESSTVLALRSLRRRLEGVPVLIIASTRPVVGGSDLARSMRSLEQCADEVVVLEPLSEAQSLDVAERVCGRALSKRDRSLTVLAAGNPLMIREALRDSTHGGGAPKSLADALQRSVARRMSSLTVDQQQVLFTAATFGTVFASSDVALAGDVPGSSVREALTHCQEQHFVVVDESSNGSFAHDVIRDIVRSLIPPEMRAQLHGAAARVVAQSGGPASTVAWHLSEQVVKGPESLDKRTWLIQAARDAAGVAPSVSSRLFLQAIDGVEDTDRDFFDLRIELLGQLSSSGMFDEAERQGRLLLGQDVSVDQELAVRWWLGSVFFVNYRLGEAQELTAPGAMKKASPQTQARLHAITALIQACRLDPSFVDGVKRSMELATQVDDASALAIATVLSARAAANDLDLDAAVAFSEDAVRIADRDRDGLAHRYQPLFFFSLRLIDAHDLPAALRALTTGRRQSLRSGTSWAESLYCAGEALIALREGRIDDSFADACASLAIADDTGVYVTAIVARCVCACVRLLRNDTEGAAEELVSAEAYAATDPLRFGSEVLMATKVRLHIARGELEQAAGLAIGAMELFSAVGFRIGALEVCIVGLSAVSALSASPGSPALPGSPGLRGEGNLADGDFLEGASVGSDPVDVKAALASINAVFAHTVEGVPSTPLVQAIAAWLHAEQEPSPVAWELAITACDAGCWVFERREVRFAALRWALQSGLAEVFPNLADEIDAFNLPMQELQRAMLVQVRRLLMQPRRRVSASSTAKNHLSPTERLVGAAIRDGKTNRVIAQELNISIRTVESHVSSVLRKLGAASRVHVALALKPGSGR
jgi:DNA-binding CsgD family transcriptional regulator